MTGLSIVIPIYNRTELLRETLDSIRAQTRNDWECVLADDGSADDTLDMVREYLRFDSRFRLIERVSSRPSGPSARRNDGFRRCRGSVVYFFDSDDLLAPTFAETFLPFFERSDSLDVLNVRLARFAGSPHRVVRRSRTMPADLTLFEAMAGSQVGQSTQNFLWRKSLLDRMSILWDERLTYGEDREFAFRAVAEARTAEAAHEPVLVYFRRNRRGLGFRQRFDRKKLENTLLIAESALRVACEKKVSQKTEIFLSRYLLGGMKLALSFGDRAAFRQFVALGRPLTAEGKDRAAAERFGRSWRFYSAFYQIRFRINRLIDAILAVF